MKKQHRIKFLTTLFILAYLLSACSGVPAGVKVDDSSINSQSVISNGNGSNVNDNSNPGNENQNNTSDNSVNANDNLNDNSNSGNDNSSVNNNANSNIGTEVFGVAEAITADSITIDGVVYMLADLTEFKDLIALGDQVKIHLIVNADGTITIREIEKSESIGIDNNNSNSLDNVSDGNSNSNGDDHGGNDDHGNNNGNDSGGGNSGGGDNENGGSNGNGN